MLQNVQYSALINVSPDWKTTRSKQPQPSTETLCPVMKWYLVVIRWHSRVMNHTCNPQHAASGQNLTHWTGSAYKAALRFSPGSPRRWRFKCSHFFIEGAFNNGVIGATSKIPWKSSLWAPEPDWEIKGSGNLRRCFELTSWLEIFSGRHFCIINDLF